MPPSPPPESTQSTPPYRGSSPSFRRATSLPPESTRVQRPSPTFSLFRHRRQELPDDDGPVEKAVEIEELSPEAIIPDSVTIMRDPVVEVPEDETTEAELEKRFTNIKLDRMHDWSGSDVSEEAEVKKPSQVNRQKRKHTPADDSDEQTKSFEQRRRKRAARPGRSSPLNVD